MSAVRLIRAPALVAVPYAYASTVAPTARLIFLAGACPLDRDGNVVAPDDFERQARQCLDNLVAALDAAGAGLTDVVSTRVLVASSERDDLGSVWQVVSERFADHDVPSTLVGVAALGYAGQLVEIEATAAIVDEGDLPRGGATAVH
jgi:enamine deaminase RidA (YjgF/YER057c/UK114 family)